MPDEIVIRGTLPTWVRCGVCGERVLRRGAFCTGDAEWICEGCARRFAEERLKAEPLFILAESQVAAEHAAREMLLSDGQWCYVESCSVLRGRPSGICYVVVPGFHRHHAAAGMLDELRLRGGVEIDPRALRQEAEAEGIEPPARSVRIREED